MTASNSQDVRHITRALAVPFDPAFVRFKPAVVQGNRALALAYVDARAIQLGDRQHLDAHNAVRPIVPFRPCA